MPGVNLKQGTYSARGYGGHYIFVIPSHDMVVVHRVNTYIQGNFVSARDVGTLLQLIFDAEFDSLRNDGSPLFAAQIPPIQTQPQNE
jgi:CubicO group peptidase (beta-lactamase class C family)